MEIQNDYEYADRKRMAKVYDDQVSGGNKEVKDLRLTSRRDLQKELGKKIKRKQYRVDNSNARAKLLARIEAGKATKSEILASSRLNKVRSARATMPLAVLGAATGNLGQVGTSALTSRGASKKKTRSIIEKLKSNAELTGRDRRIHNDAVSNANASRDITRRIEARNKITGKNKESKKKFLSSTAGGAIPGTHFFKRTLNANPDTTWKYELRKSSKP